MTRQIDATTTTEEQRVAELLDRLLSENDPRGDRFAFMGAQFDLGLFILAG
ncbi:MAG: hypothetical protein ACE5GC_07705 [Acidimicrobiia bacterium]